VAPSEDGGRRPPGRSAQVALSVVTPSVRAMPLTIRRSQYDRVETSGFDPVDAPAKESDGDPTTDDSCPCDECQAPSRDEMWSRWA
jgi:hypothetical protein